ncbi:MAG: arginine--tRNA ligase [Candidatus Eisenbacteria bacterium]
MVWTELTDAIATALRAAGLYTPERLARLELAIPRDPAHGDWTTNLALLIARDVGRSPRAIAESIVAHLPSDPERFAPAQVAGPGFINLRYSDRFVGGLTGRIRAAGERFGVSDHASGTSVLVEYVSANPTGPLNVVSARAAAVGACLVRLLRATGHRVDGEYYVNDAGNQVDLLGESLAARFAERIGVERRFPEQGYQGGYLRDLAAVLPETEGRAALAATDGVTWFREQALARMVARQRADLDDYGAEFARWFRESELHRSGAVTDTLATLETRGVTYRATRPETDHAAGAPDAHEEDGEGREEAVYLRTTRFGDDKDRVVLRGDGRPTYLLPDIAYHRDKRARGWRHAIDLWGPDHHGYIARMKAALAALGLEPDFLDVIIVQQVNLLSEGQPVKMSKRAGEFVTLRDLMDDVGADCAKFFFLMRSTSAHLDFDLDLARRHNDENPAYYVQYAHARVASILRYAAERGLTPAPPGAVDDATTYAAEERALVRKLATFPEVVRGAAMAREPHRVPTFLTETAAEFHRFYHAFRVVSEDAALTRRRLALADAARLTLCNGLTLMGVTAPERMERTSEVEA